MTTNREKTVNHKDISLISGLMGTLPSLSLPTVWMVTFLPFSSSTTVWVSVFYQITGTNESNTETTLDSPCSFTPLFCLISWASWARALLTFSVASLTFLAVYEMRSIEGVRGGMRSRE